jgi:hypothetical protein
MDIKTAIILREFSSRSQAELAALELRSRGIECTIQADDWGGMLPPFGVRLFIDPKDSETARAILEEGNVSETAAQPEPEQASPLQPSPRMNGKVVVMALGIGFLLGLLAYRVAEVMRNAGLRVYYHDLNGDGRDDEACSYEGGTMTWATLDRDFDGKWDLWYEYRRGQIYKAEGDENFDGKPDFWTTYASGSALRTEQDVDFNGEPDVTYAFSNSITALAEWKPNRSEIVTMRQVFHHGLLSEEFRDLDRDGRFDVAVKYDPFQNPIETNSLRHLGAPPR